MGQALLFNIGLILLGGVAYVNVTSKDSGGVLFVLVSLLKMVPRAEV